VIEGRVIRIFDHHTVVLDVGTNHGVDLRTRFGIWGPTVEITDPDTGDSLGPYRRRKATVVVNEVFPRFCVAATPPVRKEYVEEQNLIGLSSRIKRTQVEHASLDPHEQQIEGVPGGDSVLIGDTAESIES